MLLNKEDKAKLKEMKKQLLMEEILKKKSLPDVVSNVELLEEIIQRVNRNPGLSIELVTRDGTTMRIKSYKGFTAQIIQHEIAGKILIIKTGFKREFFIIYTQNP